MVLSSTYSKDRVAALILVRNCPSQKSCVKPVILIKGLQLTIVFIINKSDDYSYQ